MEWSCDDLDEATWSAHAQGAPLEQSWIYGEVARALGARVRRFHLCRHGRTIALAQGIERGIGPLRCLWIPRGVHAVTPDTDTGLDGLPALLPRGTILLAPEGRFAVGTMPARAELALHSDMRGTLDKKWRNRLAAAERSDLDIRRHSGCSEWLMAEERRQRKRRGYRAMPAHWLRLVADRDPGAVESWIAWRNGARVAGITCLRSGTQMRYHIGYTSPAGREISAHNLLLWRAMNDGLERGAGGMDLGCVDETSLPGLTRFKLGTGARLIAAQKIRLSTPGTYRSSAGDLAAASNSGPILARAFHRGRSVK